MPSYEYPRPALTVDVVVFAGSGRARSVVLIRRGAEPFHGMWALPGGFVNEGEPLETAARRELAEETGITLGEPLVPLGAFGDPGRDPRGWTVSAAYMMEAGEQVAVRGGDDAAEAAWFPVRGVPPLAFDHADILAAALSRSEDREKSM